MGDKNLLRNTPGLHVRGCVAHHRAYKRSALVRFEHAFHVVGIELVVVSLLSCQHCLQVQT